MLLNAISVIVGLLGTIALSETMSFENEKTAYGNSMVSFLFVVFAVVILRYVYQNIRLKDKRGIGCAAGYSFGLAFALTAGKQLHTVENFAVGNITLWIQILILAGFFFGPVLYVFQKLAEKMNTGEKCTVIDEAEPGMEEEQGSRWKAFLITWLVIFLCWIPVFLAFYPGAFVYDAQDEFVQVASREFTTHHPLTHVLLLGGCVCFGNKFLGSYNAGIALYTVLQMLVLSGAFAYTVSYLKKHVSKNICVAVTLFYGLFPVIPMYAVCSAKDTLFNAAFLVMLIQILKLMENPKRMDMVLLVLASAAMMLLRNNGVLAYLALLAIVGGTALFKRKIEKVFLKLAVLMLVSFVLYSAADKMLTVVLQADDSESQEFLTVPIQQLARTYKYSPEIFSEEDKAILFSYIPENILGVYDADLSDLVKANFNNQKYAENSSEFMGLWWKTFLKKPVTYLNAWFMTSYGYWYPDTVINVYGGQQRFTFQYGESSYFGFETEQPGERQSKFPWLEEQYRRMSLELYQQNVPGISMLFSPGFLFWIFLGCFLSCIYDKRYKWFLPMTAILLLWGTVIPGPTFLVRYVLIIWFALPLILLAGAGGKQENRNPVL